MSRGGRGAFGAGNPAQDALEAEKDPKAAIEGAIDGVQPAEATEEEEAEKAPAGPPAEPEPVTFTMDEFLKTREEARQKAVAAGLAGAAKERTVNKETEFAGMTTLSVALDDYLSASNAKAEVGRKDQRSTGKTQVLNVGFKFPTPQPEGGRGDRGDREGGRGRGAGDREERSSGRGRGEGRGRGGRGGDREGGRGAGRGRGEGRGSSSRPAGSSSVFNTADFPSL